MAQYIPKNVNSIAAKLYVTANEKNKKNANFTILWNLLNKTKTVDGRRLSEVLDNVEGAGYTLFAPNDKAFSEAEKWLKKHKGKSLEDFKSDDIRATLLYHVLAGVVTSDALIDGATPTTVSDKNLCIFVEGSGKKKQIYVNWAKIIIPDIQCSNGVIHIIDHVLIPVLECDRGMMVKKKGLKKMEKEMKKEKEKRKSDGKESKKKRARN